MSTIRHTPENTHDVTVSVVKSELSGLLHGGSEVGLDGEYIWPIAPRALANLYRSSAEHGRAIHIKAEGAFGGGLIGEAAAIDDLCETGAAELFVLLGLDLETFGNAFLQKIRSPNGERLAGLRRLPSITMSRYRAGFLQRVYTPDGGCKKVTFTADEIIHLREPCPEGRRYALPSWIGAEGMLELAQNAVKFNASFFRNGAIPEYAVIFKGATPTQEQKNQIREFFRNDFQGVENAHRTLVLTSGEDVTIEFKQLTSDVKDGDFLKLLDAARDRIPIAHGVPPRMLGIVSAGSLGGGGEVTGQLFTFEHLTLRPRRRRMLDQLRPLLRELGLRPGQDGEPVGKGEVAFRPLDLTPPGNDTGDLAALVGAGILSEDEARAVYYGDSGTSAPQSIARSAPESPLAALARILSRT